MITIAWDIDDVLNDLMREWFEQKWMVEHNNCSVLYEKLSSNPPHEILGIAQEEYLASLDDFRLSERYTEMEPVTEVMQWFEKHGDDFRHVALTAVPLKAVHQSASWLMKTFGLWIRAYHFIPSFREGESLPNYDNSKQEALKRFNFVDVFVDDTENNLIGIDEIGIQKFLFPRPWNSQKSTLSEVLEKMTDCVYKKTKYEES